MWAERKLLFSWKLSLRSKPNLKSVSSALSQWRRKQNVWPQFGENRRSSELWFCCLAIRDLLFLGCFLVMIPFSRSFLLMSCHVWSLARPTLCLRLCSPVGIYCESSMLFWWVLLSLLCLTFTQPSHMHDFVYFLFHLVYLRFFSLVCPFKGVPSTRSLISGNLRAGLCWSLRHVKAIAALAASDSPKKLPFSPSQFPGRGPCTEYAFLLFCATFYFPEWNHFGDYQSNLGTPFETYFRCPSKDITNLYVITLIITFSNKMASNCHFEYSMNIYRCKIIEYSMSITSTQYWKKKKNHQTWNKQLSRLYFISVRERSSGGGNVGKGVRRTEVRL